MKIWYKTNKSTKQTKTTSLRGFILKTLVITLALGSATVLFHYNYAAAQTSDDYCKDAAAQSTSAATGCSVGFTYCSQYTASLAFNACEAGYGGQSCDDYASFGGPDIVTDCKKGGAYKAGYSGQTCEGYGTDTNLTSECQKGVAKSKVVAPTTPSKDTTTDPSKSSDSSAKTDTSNKQLLDLLKKLNTDAASADDHQYGSYVNGAGKQQPLRVTKAPGNNNPAIVFIDGGGWHGDDGMGDAMAPKANERGYTTIVATYRLGSSGIYYMLDDVLRAMRHIRDNAGMYGIDPSRIAIWGDSAGGSLSSRAAGTGQSGAAVQVGWSAPTNAYTALFRSPQSFAIGMDHSTCVPTDLNGAQDVINQLNGQTGIDPKTGYSGGIADNNIGNGGTGLDTVTNVLEVAQQAQDTSTSAETMSKTLGDSSTLQQNGTRLAAKKFIECLDNFNSASPALFSSALSPPGYFAGYNDDPLVGPDQIWQMRDKLRSLGVPSEADTIDGTDPANDHLWKNLDKAQPFIDKTFQFVDSYLHPSGS